MNKVVKVRIALVVDSGGKWVASGDNCTHTHTNEMHTIARDYLPIDVDRTVVEYWVTVDVPRPRVAKPIAREGRAIEKQQ